MFVREKRIGPYTYVYLVETVRQDGRVRQRIIRNLGRKEEVERSGDLDRLVRSATRLAQRSMILSLLEEGGGAEGLACRRIGPPLLFERLWRDASCGDVLNELLTDRTALVIAHRLSTIERADRIMVLAGGALRESGTHDELLKQRGLYFRLFELQYTTTAELAREAVD